MPKIICKGVQNKGFGADAVVTTGMQIGGKTMPRYIDAEKIPYTDLNSDMPQSKVRVYVAFKERIDRIPTADVVEVKHGKWITMSDADGIYWACSECGEDIPRISHYNPKFNLFPRLKSIDRTNFCPSCGAKMDKKRDDEQDQ